MTAEPAAVTAATVRECTVRFVLRRNPLTRDFGLALMPRGGVHFVTVVEEDSEAYCAGIKVGDGVCEVNGRSPPLDSVATQLPPRHSDEYVTLTVRRAVTSAVKPVAIEPSEVTVAQEASGGAAERDLAAAPAARSLEETAYAAQDVEADAVALIAASAIEAQREEAERSQVVAVDAAPARADGDGSSLSGSLRPPSETLAAPTPAPPRPEASQSVPDRVAQTLGRAASESFNIGFLKDMLRCGSPRGRRRVVSTVPGQQGGISAERRQC